MAIPGWTNIDWLDRIDGTIGTYVDVVAELFFFFFSLDAVFQGSKPRKQPYYGMSLHYSCLHHGVVLIR